MKKKCIRISALGGSGEMGRNCFAIENGEEIFLLDCGVKREIQNGQVGFYPHLTPEFVAKIKAVFLSHCHEDHVAALPLLYELGFKGKVYASTETIETTPTFIKKWVNYVQANNGKLPFSDDRIAQIEFSPIQLGKNTIEQISIETGRSGHVLGGIWFKFYFDETTILYTGDMVLNPTLLQVDIPGESDNAIMNCAYANQAINQQEQFDSLLSSINNTLSVHGLALLPLPPKGRSSDILYYLLTHLTDTTLHIELEILNCCTELINKSDWVQNSQRGHLSESLTINVIINSAQRENALKNRNAVYLAADGMLTTKESRYCYEQIKNDSNSKVIISGHVAKGTVANNILDSDYRSQNNVKCQVDKIIFKAHLDDNDVLWLNQSVKAKNILFFHAPKDQHTPLIEKLKEQNIYAACITYPEWMTVKK